MIFVTGTKRSGTSMWMQVLIAAGFPYIGEAYSGQWERSIKDANRRGFWESRLRRGVYFATNPDPRTGDFLFPHQTTGHVVKVFIPGLIRTDYAFLDRVVATIRPWREYVTSIQRLYALEDDFFATNPPPDPERARSRPRVPPAIEWWMENYDLIRDIATRKYPVNLVSYQRMLEDPRAVIEPVLTWLGHGDLDAAVAAVDPTMKTQTHPTLNDPHLDDQMIQTFDALHQEIYERQALSRALLGQMNDLHARIEAQWLTPPGEPQREKT